MAATNQDVLQTSIELLQNKATRLRIDRFAPPQRREAATLTSCASAAEIMSVLFFFSCDMSRKIRRIPPTTFS